MTTVSTYLLDAGAANEHRRRKPCLLFGRAAALRLRLRRRGRRACGGPAAVRASNKCSAGGAGGQQGVVWPSEARLPSCCAGSSSNERPWGSIASCAAMGGRGTVGHVGPNDMRLTWSSAGRRTETAGGEAPELQPRRFRLTAGRWSVITTTINFVS